VLGGVFDGLAALKRLSDGSDDEHDEVDRSTSLHSTGGIAAAEAALEGGVVLCERMVPMLRRRREPVDGLLGSDCS
jgi:hypothetical protein